MGSEAGIVGTPFRVDGVETAGHASLAGKEKKRTWDENGDEEQDGKEKKTMSKKKGSMGVLEASRSQRLA
jgi:hypothetical protein